jgi:hypothetical protein
LASAFSNPASGFHGIAVSCRPAPPSPLPEKTMTRRRIILILSVSTALGAIALAASRARDVPEVATGFIASVLCSETFVSGLDPERSLSETTAAMPGAGLLTRAMDYRVDRTRKEVTVTLLGFGRSHAVYREGLGCHLEHGDTAAALESPPFDAYSQPALLPELAAPLPSLPSRRSAAPRRSSWSGMAASSPNVTRMVTASIRRSSASPRPSR